MTLCLCIGMLDFTRALAANIYVETRGNGNTVFVKGILVPTDGARFANVVATLGRSLVILESDGGNLAAGLQIGAEIRSKRFITLVREGTRCASACAIAWLGGLRRFMAPGSHIGFHAAYSNQDGETIESAPANALMGGYLKTIGLSDQAVVYITQAGPKDMTWLDPSDAKQEGIDVSLVAPVSNRAEPEILDEPSEQISSDSLENLVTEFAKDYFLHWSDSNLAALEFFDGIYDKKVNYGGIMLDRSEIIQHCCPVKK